MNAAFIQDQAIKIHSAWRIVARGQRSEDRRLKTDIKFHLSITLYLLPYTTIFQQQVTSNRRNLEPVTQTIDD